MYNTAIAKIAPACFAMRGSWGWERAEVVPESM